MKRSLFFTLSAIICFLFGVGSLLVPFQATEQFGIAITPATSLIVRSLGGMIFSMGILYLLIRNQGDSILLKQILVYSIVAHCIGLGVTVYGMGAQLMPTEKLIPNLAVHLFMAVGSAYYWSKLKHLAN